MSTKIPSDAPASQTDPLLREIINRLPAAGIGNFPPDQRASWLRMLINGLEVVYGGPLAGVTLESVVAGPAGGGMTVAAIPAAVAAAPAPTAPPPPPVRPHFAIDAEGIVRKMPERMRVNIGNLGAGDVLFDYRGEHGDLASITWADGSRGVQGRTIDISAGQPH